jgi:EAL domain-containing protein (putative c-di-GMP-specific phosphodiesterase class I)/anti-sigma regulatory factor (Ser/Thr protein kinase)
VRSEIDSAGQGERRRRARRISDVTAPQPDSRPPLSAKARDGRRATTPWAAAALGLPYALGFAFLAWSLSPIVSSESISLALVAMLGCLAWLAVVLPMLGGTGSGWSLGLGARGRTVRAVRKGMERGELELHYQPQIDLRSGNPYGVEALLRWRHGGALILPADFLPAVESSDLIAPLTHRVLDMALRQASKWHDAGREMRIAVNLSAANLRDYRVVNQLDDLLAKHGTPPSMLTLEVTETSVLEEPEQTRAVLDAIADLGVSISIDDFGAGYSSLLWLRIFPVDEVKVDRVFVAQLDGEGKAFVEGVIRLARDIGVKVLAEGIEEPGILEGLQALGCRAGQGFLFARAMPAAEVAGWMDAHETSEWARREATLSIEPTFDAIETARRLVEDEAEEAGMCDSDVWDLRVAATEALSNAIEHAPLAADGMIHIRITREQGELLLEITGGGNPDGRHLTSDPNRGRGIGIMTALMDEVEMRHVGGRGVIRLAKRIEAAPATSERAELRPTTGS